jgi:hypothetical protein
VFAHPLCFACDGAHLPLMTGPGARACWDRPRQIIIIVPVQNYKKGWGVSLQFFW